MRSGFKRKNEPDERKGIYKTELCGMSSEEMFTEFEQKEIEIKTKNLKK